MKIYTYNVQIRMHWLSKSKQFKTTNINILEIVNTSFDAYFMDKRNLQSLIKKVNKSLNMTTLRMSIFLLA